eukprot:scaffold9425_cov99-Isochrysis_galbana.AAC.1
MHRAQPAAPIAPTPAAHSRSRSPQPPKRARPPTPATAGLRRPAAAPYAPAPSAAWRAAGTAAPSRPPPPPAGLAPEAACAAGAPTQQPRRVRPVPARGFANGGSRPAARSGGGGRRRRGWAATARRAAASCQRLLRLQCEPRARRLLGGRRPMRAASAQPRRGSTGPCSAEPGHTVAPAGARRPLIGGRASGQGQPRGGSATGRRRRRSQLRTAARRSPLPRPAGVATLGCGAAAAVSPQSTCHSGRRQRQRRRRPVRVVRMRPPACRPPPEIGR